jgi:hypothetical protein
MNCGETLLMPLRGPFKAHLWIVVTQPVNNQCVIVSLTTLREDRDQTLILNTGDHPFIDRASTILYADAQLANDISLMAQISEGRATPRQACTPEVLRLIQDGILRSPHTKKNIASYCRTQWNLEAAAANSNAT